MAATANYVRITKSSLTERRTCIKIRIYFFCFVLFLHSFFIGYVVLIMFRRVILSFCHFVASFWEEHFLQSKSYVKQGCQLGKWLTKLDVAYLDTEWEGLSHLWSGGKSCDPNSFGWLEWNKKEAIFFIHCKYLNPVEEVFRCRATENTPFLYWSDATWLRVSCEAPTPADIEAVRWSLTDSSNLFWTVMLSGQHSTSF